MIQYNDYELLYLMNEFDEEAEKIFYEKYTNLIKMRIYKFRIKERYQEDFLQEGLYMLFVATRMYNEYSKKTFNKYFDLILQRRFIRLLAQEKHYFYEVDLHDDELMLADPNTFVYDEMNYNSLSSFEEKVLDMKKKNYRPREIAKLLKCDVKSVYNCLCRIKNKFNE